MHLTQNKTPAEKVELSVKSHTGEGDIENSRRKRAKSKFWNIPLGEVVSGTRNGYKTSSPGGVRRSLTARPSAAVPYQGVSTRLDPSLYPFPGNTPAIGEVRVRLQQNITSGFDY